jgi:hypothetical protein
MPRPLPVRKLLALLACLASPVVFAESFGKPEVTVELPAGWVEVPADVMQAFYDEMQRAAPKAQVPKYNYAFQAASGPPWLSYPYVLVKVTPSGRPTESELENLPTIDVNAKIKDKSEDWSSLMKDTSLGQMRYDKAANVVWITSKSDVVNIGTVQGISGIVPTEKGFVELHAYARAEDFAGHAQTFENIITSAKIAPALLYTPRWSDKLGPAAGLFDPSRLGAKLAIGAILGILLVIFLSRRRKPD